MQFVMEWKKSETTMTARVRNHAATGYKWIKRYFEDGDEGGAGSKPG
jgi:hypothetical protein